MSQNKDLTFKLTAHELAIFVEVCWAISLTKSLYDCEEYILTKGGSDE